MTGPVVVREQGVVQGTRENVAAVGLAIVAWTFVSWFTNGGSPWPVAALVLAGVGAFALARAIGRTLPRLPVAAIVVAGTWVAVVGRTSLIGGPPLSRPFQYANAEAAFFGLAAIAAVMLATMGSRLTTRSVAVVLAVGLGFLSVTSGSTAMAILLPTLIAAALAATTAGRSGRAIVVAFAGGFLAMLLITTLIAAAPNVVPFSTQASRALTDRRIDLWHDAWTLMTGQPITGVGPGNFPTKSPTARSDADTRLAHHEFLQQGAEQGVLGYLMAIAMFLVVFRAIAAQPHVGRTETLGAAALCLMAMHACVDYVLHVPALTISAAALAGVGASSGQSTIVAAWGAPKEIG